MIVNKNTYAYPDPSVLKARNLPSQSILTNSQLVPGSARPSPSASSKFTESVSQTPQGKGRLLAVMNIDIAKDKKDTIYIHQYDDQGLLARAFQIKHSLPTKAFSILVEQIKKQKQQYLLQNNQVQRSQREEGPSIDYQQEQVDKLVHHSTQDNDMSRTKGNSSKAMVQLLPSFRESQIRKNNEQSYQQKQYRNYEEPSQQSVEGPCELSFESALWEEKRERESLFEESHPDFIREESQESTPISSRGSRPYSQSSTSSPRKVIDRLANDQLAKMFYLRSLEKRVLLQQHKILQETKQCTHAPQVNKISSVLASQRKQNKNIAEHLYSQAAEIDFKKQKERETIMKKIQNQYTFQPTISNKSLALLESKNQSLKKLRPEEGSSGSQMEKSVSSKKFSGIREEGSSQQSSYRRSMRSSIKVQYEHLFAKTGQTLRDQPPQQPKPRQTIISASQSSRLRSISQQHLSFRPQINPISKKIVASKGKDFTERNKNYEQSKKEKLSEMYRKAKLWETIDPKTGRMLFRPNVARSDIKEKLSTKQAELLINELSVPKKPVQIVIDQKPNITEESESIVKNRRQRRLAYIFGELDSDHDGVISASKIDIISLKEDVLEVISPILFQMEEGDHTLTLAEFREAALILHSKLNSQQKAILYNYPGRGI